MWIRFNRSAAVREAYALYDAGGNGDVIRFCTRHLKEPGADPELRILRGVAYSDRLKPDEAYADWKDCCSDPHVGGVAHFYLGNFLREQGLEHHAEAWDHFARATELGWVEGHVGKGQMLFDRGCRLRDEARDTEGAKRCFEEALAELALALTSTSRVQGRAMLIRSGVHYALGDMEACARDARLEGIVPTVAPRETDPRATGAELYG